MYKLKITAQFMSIPEVIRGHLGNFNSQVPMRFNIFTEEEESIKYYLPAEEGDFSFLFKKLTFLFKWSFALQGN